MLSQTFMQDNRTKRFGLSISLAVSAIACSPDYALELLAVTTDSDEHGDRVIQVHVKATGEDGAGRVCSSLLWIDGEKDYPDVNSTYELSEEHCEPRIGDSTNCSGQRLICFDLSNAQGTVCYRGEIVTQVTECLDHSLAQGEEATLEIWLAPIQSEHRIVLTPDGAVDF